MSNGKKKSFVPKLYLNAPRRTKDGFVRYIIEFEDSRGNRRTKPEANSYFQALVQMSRKAEKECRPDDVIIDHDPHTGEWGGRETPYHCESYNMRRGKKSIVDTYRGKFSTIGEGGITKAEFVAEIQNLERCSAPVARTIFESCRRREIALHCKETGLWFGCFVEDWPTHANKPAAILKKTEYRQKFGRMPAKSHNYQDKQNSELLQWLVAEEAGRGITLTIDEADKLRHRIWNVAKDDESRVWKVVRKEGNRAQIQGVDFGLPEGQVAGFQAPVVERKVKPKFIAWGDGYLIINGRPIGEEATERLWYRPYMTGAELRDELADIVGFDFDFGRLIEEQSYNVEDGTGDEDDCLFLTDGKRYCGANYPDFIKKKKEEEAERERIERNAKAQAEKLAREEATRIAKIQAEKERLEQLNAEIAREEAVEPLPQPQPKRSNGFRGKATFKQPETIEEAA